MKEMNKVIEDADVYCPEDELLKNHIRAKATATARVCSFV